MASLSEQELFVPLGAGVRRDIDEHLLPVGKTRLVFNGIYNALGQLVKRPGSTVLGAGTTPGVGVINNTWQLATYKNALVNLERAPTATPIEAYSPTANQWSRVGSQTTEIAALATGRRGQVGHAVYPVASDANLNSAGDIAVSNGFIFIAFVTLSTTVALTVLDETTKKVVYRWKVAGTATKPRIVITNGYLSLFYFDATPRVKADVWLISAFDTGSGTPTTSNVTGTAVQGFFDAIQATSTTIAVAWTPNPGGTTFRNDFTPSTGGSTTIEIRTTAVASISSTLAIAWLSDLFVSGKLSIATVGPAGLQVQWNLTAGTPATTYVLDAGATANITFVCGHTLSNSATGEIQVLYNDLTSPTDSQIKIGQRTVAAGITNGLWIRSVGIVSRTFVNAANVYVVVNYNYSGSAFKTHSAYLMRIGSDALTNPNANPQARFLTWDDPQTDIVNTGPTSVAISGATFIVPMATRNSTSTSNTTAISAVALQFNPSVGRPCEGADGLLVPGSLPAIFDGLNFGPFDFDIIPETPAAPTQVGGGSLTNPGTYIYQFVYAVIDANGRTYRSAPSVPVSVVTANTRLNWLIPSLRIGGVGVKIEAYRTISGVTSPLTFVASVDNNPNAATTVFADVASDASIAANDPIYTTGGILPHEPAPGFSSIIAAGGRLFGVSMDDPNEIWPSNILVPGEGPSFSSDFVIRIEDENGPLLGIGNIDDKVVPFKANAIYAFNGEGPDALGRGSFGQPQIIARGIGTTNPQSILGTPEGVAFMSTATTRGGLQLIDRSLSISINADGSSWGAAVKDDTDTGTIVAAALVPELSQARFYLASKIVLVYDFVRKAWTEFFYVQAAGTLVHATYWNGSGAYGLSNNLVYADRTSGGDGTYSDDGAAFFFTVDTPWIQLAGVSGFQRLWKVQGVGASPGTHVLTVQTFADFNRATPSGSYSGTPGSLWDWELVPRVQLCRAVMVRVSDNSSLNAGPAIAGVTFTMGVLPGANRIGSGKRLQP